MKRRGFQEEQIIGVLRRAKRARKTATWPRRARVSEATSKLEVPKYGGLEVSEAGGWKALDGRETVS